MEKKDYKNKIIVALVLLIIAIILIGAFAFSRYTSSIKGSGTATVAKWSFDSTGLDSFARTDGVSLASIATDKLAPGTSGVINAGVDATGCEVSVDYKVIISNVKNKPTNLKFYSDAACTKEITASNGTYTVEGSIAANATDKTVSVPIYWKWNYNSTADNTIDSADTTDGTTAATMTFSIEAIGTQGTPQ